jgi:hypothetical protein
MVAKTAARKRAQAVLRKLIDVMALVLAVYVGGGLGAGGASTFALC